MWRCDGSLLQQALRTICLVSAYTAVVYAQQAIPGGQGASNQSGYTLKVRSQLVLLDTVVRDKTGKAVRHLMRDDFSILQDGIPQPIVGFEATDAAGAEKPRLVVASTEELEQKAPRWPVTILVLDELTTHFEDEYFARYALGRYLDAQGETLNTPTMLLARSYDRTMVLHDYTTSKTGILNALNRHFVGNDWKAKTPDQVGNLFGAALVSLVEIAKATQAHQGHKNLIWIGRGFPTVQWANLSQEQAGSLQNAIITCSNLLKNARMTLYSVDPAGVAGTPESSVDMATGALTPDDPFGGQIDFDSMVRETGGRSMHGRNDVDRLIAEAVSRGEVFYTLAYRPHESGGDPKKLHELKVVTKNPSLTAITRTSFYIEDSPASSVGAKVGDISHAKAADLAAALSSLLVYNDIPIDIGRVGQTDQYRLALPASALNFEESSGKLSTQIDLIAVSFDRGGKPLSKSIRTISVTMPLLPSGKVEDRKLTVMSKIGDDETARLRFVVRTRSGDKIGAENFFLIDRNLLKDPLTGLKPVKPRIPAQF